MWRNLDLSIIDWSLISNCSISELRALAVIPSLSPVSPGSGFLFGENIQYQSGGRQGNYWVSQIIVLRESAPVAESEL